MSKDVTVTVSWAIKPECTGAFVAALEGMFPVTRLREGFRNIRLLKGDTDAGQFLLVEAHLFWSAKGHAARFRGHSPVVCSADNEGAFELGVMQCTA